MNDSLHIVKENDDTYRASVELDARLHFNIDRSLGDR